MFSIAAVNDTDSVSDWQPLAPTKEAQEFNLSQLYHDGLLKLQSKDYVKARELLEAVLKDPLISNTEVENSASNSHLSQLRFLALKNLATVFLEQGPPFHESALQCYLQAVEIDAKDYVTWNQLGTLSCSMGSLSISRWAFEQALVCSPKNWNCMEKLLEVLIAIGDEVACLSVAELILSHWPCHSRALHVKNTIEDSEVIPFTPRGIDRLEPKHKRLTFREKRKAEDEVHEGVVSAKKLKKNIEVELSDASWLALVSELLNILHPLSASCAESETENYRSGDIGISIQLPPSSEKLAGSTETEQCKGIQSLFGHCNSLSNEKEETPTEEQHQERRSSRLETLRSRKPGKEESDSSSNKDLAQVVKKFLLPYLVDLNGTISSKLNLTHPFECADMDADSFDSESTNVIEFVQNTINNFGAYHMSHLLLEQIASRSILHREGIAKILDLEKAARNWGQERTPECSLFLSELYYDMGSQSFETSTSCGCMSDSSYHLCKVIESLALDYPFLDTKMDWQRNCPTDVAESDQLLPIDDSFLLRKNHCFWIRFFWLNAQLSLLDGDHEKALKELSITFAFFMDKDKKKSPFGPIFLPHRKVARKLTADRVHHEINLLEVDYLLKNSAGQMLEKNMHVECIDMLAPLLLSTNDVHFSVLHDWKSEDELFDSVELSALDILIRSCGLAEPTNIDIYSNCHKRKLEVLLAGAGLVEIFLDKSELSSYYFSESRSKESRWKHWYYLVAEELKAVSEFASRIKSIINRHENPSNIPISVIGDIQSLLLMLMCGISTACFAKKSSALGVPESIGATEQQRCFVDAAIAFCKLQHLNVNIHVKSQTELTVAIHDMLAEFGICCAQGSGEEQEGTFLKLAIKHLLTLHMKLKSDSNHANKGQERNLSEHASKVDDSKTSEKPSQSICIEESTGRSCSRGLDMKAGQSDIEKANALGEENVSLNAEDVFSNADTEEVGVKYESNVHPTPEGICSNQETGNSEIECEKELTDDEREELELSIDSALDQCFHCLYGLNIRLESTSEEDLVKHKNTIQGDYQTKEQCADVFQYILPYAKASSKTGLIKLRRVLRAIRKHFHQPPDSVLTNNAIDKFLNNLELCEDKLSEEAGSKGFLDTMMKIIYPKGETVKQQNEPSGESISDPYLEVYCNLYYLLAQSEEMSASDKWAGFVLTKEGEEFVDNNANLFKYDLLYNPLRFESWQKLATIYDEEVELLLNDGSKQINVLEWRKNTNLSQRVEASRRKSRRCLLMTLALSKTANQQGEIHELLALVYYDSLQNVVPFYDQRSVVMFKDQSWKKFCQNSMNHFKKALNHKEDWSHAFYLGKLCEKLEYPHEVSFSYYARAITLNPSAVDPFYRMHASRLKLLCKCGTKNEKALKVVAAYSFAESAKDTVMNILDGHGSESSDTLMHVDDEVTDINSKGVNFCKFQETWDLLYSDCLSALGTCVEGDLKHFHKARYMLAQGLHSRGRDGDVEKAKEELAFCFKSSRSSFTINMWEIDSTVKKGRRKNIGPSGNRRALEVNFAETSRKFITCLRKYMLFYLKLLEETGDVSTLDRAYISLRADKRFSLCIEDLVPVALGRYIKALIESVHRIGTQCDTTTGSVEQLLEKLFVLFLEQVNLWSDICNLPEFKSLEWTESNLYAYIYQYIQLLEKNIKVETLEAINEKIRKRLKNPKLSNSNFAKVYRHVSAAWCRSLVISMALITPLHSRHSTEIRDVDISGGGGEAEQLLCVDLQSEELWTSAFEDTDHLKNLETKWNPSLSKIKNVIIKRVSDGDLESASTLLRSSYNFYKDTSCALLPSGINLYTVPAQLATETYVQPGIDGVDIIDMNTSRKLLVWAFSLLHGHYTNVSHIIKCCEENTKSKVKKGTGGPSTSSNANTQTSASQAVGNKETSGRSIEPEVQILTHETANADKDTSTSQNLVEIEGKCTEKQMNSPDRPSLIHCNNPPVEMSSLDMQHDENKWSDV